MKIYKQLILILLLFLCACAGAGCKAGIQEDVSEVPVQTNNAEAIPSELKRQNEEEPAASQPPVSTEDQSAALTLPSLAADASVEEDRSHAENIQESSIPASEEPNQEAVEESGAQPSEEAPPNEAAPSNEKPLGKIIQESSEKPSEEATKSENFVTISIVCIDEAILEAVEVEIEEGDTVFGVLKQVTRERRIHMDFSGSGGAAYVMGINNIYEFDMGPESGWLYKVNGTVHSIGSGMYELKYGDVIEWVYTKEL